MHPGGLPRVRSHCLLARCYLAQPWFCLSTELTSKFKLDGLNFQTLAAAPDEEPSRSRFNAIVLGAGLGEPKLNDLKTFTSIDCLFFGFFP